MAARFYLQILDYRKIDDPKERKEKHGFWDFVHRSQVFKVCLFLFGLANIFCGLLSAHTDIKNALNWTQAENVAYYILQRPFYVLGAYCILFTIFCGGMSMGKTFLSRPFFLIGGKMSFEAALITPIMIQVIYTTMP